MEVFIQPPQALLKDSVKIVLKRLCAWEWDLFEWACDRYTSLTEDACSTRLAKTLHTHTAIIEKDLVDFLERTQKLMRWLGGTHGPTARESVLGM